ncbi:hypothetical protein D9M70_537380 [compost metagenome]
MAAEAADRRHAGRELRHGRGIAVIGVVGGDHPGPTGHGLGYAKRDVVGFASGAGQDRRVEAIVEGRGQPLDIVENAFVQVAGVGIERRRLPGDRLGHPWMAMADMRYVVVAV